MDFYSMNLAAGMSGGGGGGESNVAVITGTGTNEGIQLNASYNDLLPLITANKSIFVVVDNSELAHAPVVKSYGFLMTVFANDSSATIEFWFNGSLEVSLTESDFANDIFISY